METAATSYCEQTQIFFSMLTKDDRNSYYVLSSDESGCWVDTPVKREQLSLKRFDASHNYYISRNGFCEKRRRSQATRQINAFFYDLDCHGASDADCRRLVTEAHRLIQEAVLQKALPEPSMVVDSGRGLHLYYVLQRSIPYHVQQDGKLTINEKGVTFFQDVQARIADILEEVLSDLEGLTVDRAVFDYTRVSRIPGTYNSKANRFAQLVGGSYQFWHLTDLAVFRPSKKTIVAPKSKNKPQIITFNHLMMSRLASVIKLQEYREFKCEGVRERLCFVFYNTAAQIYQRDYAKDRLISFNARFEKPLPQAELEGIFKAVDSVKNIKGGNGYYVLSAETLVRFLELSKDEVDKLHFFASKRVMDRLEAKRQTREKKEARNNRICELYSQGSMTQREVADAVGCSERTVYTALKERGLAGRSGNAHKIPQQAPALEPSPVPNKGNINPYTSKTGGSVDQKEPANFWQPCQEVVKRVPFGNFLPSFLPCSLCGFTQRAESDPDLLPAPSKHELLHRTLCRMDAATSCDHPLCYLDLPLANCLNSSDVSVQSTKSQLLEFRHLTQKGPPAV